MSRNPFKELVEEETIKAPPHLENKIFGTFNFLNSLLKVLELFMGNLFGVMLGMLSVNAEHTPPNTKSQPAADPILKTTEPNNMPDEENLDKDNDRIK